jgi:hypothetical protein
MPAKTKNTKTPKTKASLESIQKDQQKERKLLGSIMRQEQYSKWLLIAIIVLLLLLILFAGYATDWLRGLKKDDTGTTGIKTSLDSATTPNESTADSANSGGGGSTGGGGTTTTGSNTGSTSTTNTGTTSTARESTSATTNNSTTNNSSTTTNNNTTTPTEQESKLLNLYADTSIGETISSVLNDASLLGVSKECRNEVLIQVCDFRDGDLLVTTKNLLGTGLITSITKNF